MQKYQKLAIFVALFAVLGVAYLIITKAATPNASFEAENATIAGNAVNCTDVNAASGKFVKLNAASCSTTPPPPPSDACSASGLKFCDDFTGSAGAAPDNSKWSILDYASNWGVECFTNSPNNIALDGQGNLKLTVKKEATHCSGRSYSSGGMETGDNGSKYKFQYGRVEIRAKVACGGGVWPALWTATGDGPSWPNSGEIDMLEVMDGDQFDAQQTIHGGPQHWQINTQNKSSTRWCQAYHTYGVDWRKGSMKFMIDGAVTHTLTPSDIPSGQTWPFDTYNQRILIDLQIGSWGGTINDADLPSSMLVDYIRIFN